MKQSFAFTVSYWGQGRSQPANEVYAKKKSKGWGGVWLPFVGCSWILSDLSFIFFLQINASYIPYLYEIQNTVDLNAIFFYITFYTYMYVTFLKYEIVWYISNGFFILFNYQEVIVNENIELKLWIGIGYWNHRSVFQNFI